MDCREHKREVKRGSSSCEESVCSSLCALKEAAGVMHLNGAALLTAPNTDGSEVRVAACCSWLLLRIAACCITLKDNGMQLQHGSWYMYAAFCVRKQGWCRVSN